MLGGAVNHPYRMRAGQRQLDPDRSGRATCAEQDNTLAVRVNHTFERHQKSLPIGILADVLVAPANCTIDSTHNRCGLAETIKMLYHRELVRIRSTFHEEFKELQKLRRDVPG